MRKLFLEVYQTLYKWLAHVISIGSGYETSKLVTVGDIIGKALALVTQVGFCCVVKSF